MIFAAAALLLASCTGEKNLVPEQITNESKLVEYTFTVDPETKAAISDAGAFSWATGDEVAVWDSQNSTYDKFVVNASDASITISGTGAADADYTTAYYPYSVASATAGENAIVWPASYATAADAAKTFPMMAVNDGGTLHFRHLGALVKVAITDLPSNVSSLVFKANEGLSGTLAVNASTPDEPFCAAGSSAASVEVSTDGATKDGDNTVIYVPLPAGTLSGFSIDMKLGTKVVGNKSKASAFTVGRAQLIPMKAFTPVFNWPISSDAFDSGYAKGTEHKAAYPESERNAYDPQIKNNTKLQSTGLAQCTLDRVTYYYVLTFNNNRWTTGQVNGPNEWMDLDGDLYDNTVPLNRCFSWKVNRPGKLSYFCCTYHQKFLTRGIQYTLVLLKTVDGIKTAKVLGTIKPDKENIVYTAYTDGSSTVNVSGWASNYDDPNYNIEFEVTAEDLLGIDEPATLFFYHHTTDSGGATMYHLPIRWTPSVDE